MTSPVHGLAADSHYEEHIFLQGVLLVGFSSRDAGSIQHWFDGIEKGLKIACCQNEHLGRSMDDIFSAPHGLLQHDCSWEEQTEAVPRAVIFSGMTQKGMLGIAEFWSLSGEPPRSRTNTTSSCAPHHHVLLCL